MKQKKYLRLITKIYFELEDELFNYEYGNGIQGSDQMSSLKKKMFIERILRNQKAIEKKHFVTKDEFEKGCHIAVYNLNEHIYFEASKEINRLGEYRSYLKNNKELKNTEIKILAQKTQNEIDNFDFDNYLSDLSLLDRSLKGKMCHNDTMFIEWIFEDFSFEKIESKNNDDEKIQDYTNELWFKVGVKFATGEMYDLIKKNNGNCSEVARILGNASYRPYISDTISTKENADKNILSKKDKVIKIYNYCLENDIKIHSIFLDKYNLIEQE